MIKGIHHFSVTTCAERLEETIEFWKILGFCIRNEDENNKRKHFIFENLSADINFELFSIKKFIPVDKEEKYKEVLEIKLKQKVTDFKKTGTGKIFSMRDPNGYVIEFYEKD